MSLAKQNKMVVRIVSVIAAIVMYVFIWKYFLSHLDDMKQLSETTYDDKWDFVALLYGTWIVFHIVGLIALLSWAWT